jgi:polysaccharide pyruvyl transferase WcaK-like protein
VSEAWIVLGSANGSRNLGDECMWYAAVEAVREVEVGCSVVTDGISGWEPPHDDVVVLPFLYPSLRRGRSLAGRGSALVAAAERLISYPGRVGYASRHSSPLPGPETLGDLGTQWFEAIAASRGLIISGAGAMNDDYAVHGLYSWSVLAGWAKQLGKPVALVGQGIGPINDDRNRSAARSLLARAELVGVRDARSAEAARELGVSESALHETPDWALAARIGDEARQRAEALHLEYTGGAPFTAVSIHRRASTTRSDLRAIGRSVERYVLETARSGKRAVFVPNMTGGRYSDDRETARVIVGGWSERARAATAIHMGQSDPAVVKALIGRADGLLSTRYHPLVFSLAMGTPAIGLAYDEYYVRKLTGASANFGVADNVLGASDLLVPADVQARLERQRLAGVAVDRDAIVGPLHRWLRSLQAAAPAR